MFAVATLIALLPLLAKASPIGTRVEKRYNGQFIHLGSDTSKCLSVQRSRSEISDGYIVQYVDCLSSGGYANQWDISPGNNPNGIQLTGTNFCLDAGSNPGNNVGMKVWTCYPGLFQQTWYFTDDNHIAITGGNQCLDNEPTGPQTYQCVGGNTNQIWSIGDFATGGGGPSTSSIGGGTSTSTAGPVTTSTAGNGATSTAGSPTSTVTASPVHPTVVPGSQQLHWNGNDCVTFGHGYLASGSSAYINGCANGADNEYAAFQQFFVTRNQAGPIKVATNPSLCLDAGVSPGNNGSPITIYECLTNSDGTPIAQQNWYYTNDNHLAITGGTQCLDVVADSQQSEQKPDGAAKQLQTWQCSGTDQYQIFTI